MRLEEIKLKKKEENNCTRKLYQMFVVLYLYLIAFEYVIAKESF